MKKLLCAICAVVLALGMCTGCNKTSLRPDDEVQIFMANGNFFSDAKKDSVWQKIEEEVGIKLDIQGYTHGDDYYVTLNPKLNGGMVSEYPDVIFAVPDLSTAYVRWADQKSGVLQDVGALLQKYPGEYPYLEAVMLGSQYGNLVYAGAHTLMPFITQPSGWGIYYRSDWLVNVGEVNEDGSAKVPVTLEDFERVMRKFREDDPNKSGKKDTYAMSPGMLPHFMNPLYHAFGVSVDYDINANGDIEYFYATEEYKNFLAWMSTCYRNEYIDPQYYANQNDADRRHFEEGRTGIIITNAEDHVPVLLGAFEAKQGSGKVVMGPAPVGTANLGKEGASGFSNWGGFWGGFSITTACSEAKTKNILKLFDYLYSPEGSMLKYAGIEGQHYTIEDGAFVPNISERRKEPSGTWVLVKDDAGVEQPTGQYVLGGNFGTGTLLWDEEANPATGYREFGITRDYKTANPKYGDLMEIANTYAQTLKTSKLVNVTAYSSTALTVTSKLLDIAATYTVKAVSGQKNTSSDWTAMLKDMNDAGYQNNITEIRQVAQSLGLL